MLKRNQGQAVLFMALAAALGGCIDDSYNLDDIDTTTEIKVNDLTLPVNIDQVTLDDIITFDDDSKIKPIDLDGKKVYALVEEGSFDSKPIHIDEVKAEAPTLNPTVDELEQLKTPVGTRAFTSQDFAVTYVMTEMGNQFSYESDDIDPAVEDLVSAQVSPLVFSIYLQAKNVENSLEKMYFTDLKIQMPKGLTIIAEETNGTYDAETGFWTISRHDVDGSSTMARLTANEVNFKANGAKIKNHSLSLDTEFKVLSGRLTIEPKMENGIPRPLPENLSFRIDYDLTDLVVESLTGRIKYDLEDMDIAPVTLGDIPDFLSGEGTNITLANPQIYLQTNNPVASDKLRCQSGLSLTALRDNAPAQTYSANGGAEAITIGYGNTPNVYNFLISPSKEGASIPAEYAANISYVPFSTLGQILSSETGAGIPEKIAINLVKPCIPSQTVNNFPLGRDLDAVNGNYKLIAPLALGDKSVILYTHREDGWNDEDVDALTITKLTVTADVTNLCPVDATVTIYPLDKQGNRIDANLQSTLLKADTPDQKLEVTLTGEIKHLDGVDIVARVEAGNDQSALAPSQTITLKNIRATVSGSYIKKL